MRVKMLESEAGVVWPDRPAVHLRKHEIHDVPDNVARKWITIGLAEQVVSAVRDVVVADTDVAGEARTTKPRARTRRNED